MPSHLRGPMQMRYELVSDDDDAQRNGISLSQGRLPQDRQKFVQHKKPIHRCGQTPLGEIDLQRRTATHTAVLHEQSAVRWVQYGRRDVQMLENGHHNRGGHPGSTRLAHPASHPPYCAAESRGACARTEHGTACKAGLAQPDGRTTSGCRSSHYRLRSTFIQTCQSPVTRSHSRQHP